MAVVVLTVLLVGTQVFGQPYGPQGGWRGKPKETGCMHTQGWHPMAGEKDIRFEYLLHRLDLTEEQAEQVRDVLDGNKESAEAGRDAVAEAMKAVHNAVAEGADKTTIRNGATALGDAIGDASILKVSTMASIRKVLTEEQLAKLNECISERKEHHGQFGERMRGPVQRPMFQDQRGGWERRQSPRGGRGPMGGQGPMGMGGRGPVQRPMFQDQRGGWERRQSPRGGRGPVQHPGFQSQRGGQGFGGGRGPMGGGGFGGGMMGGQGMPEQRGGPDIDRLFERFDSNGDGQLSREELEALTKGMRNRGGEAQ